MSTAATDAPGAGHPSALPPGTRLAEFEIRQVVGIGGFGIVYLAFDHALEREVAIKEYMPSSLVGRTATLHVSLRSQADAQTFDIGLRSFVNEARLLASFDHPSLLKVLRFWEDNGTAYMAMPVLRGQTLKQLRQAGGSAPDEAWLRKLLGSMLDALERLHGAKVFHRDISPDNIQIEPDGRAVLLDFGAARRVATDQSQTLTAILKPAYAPIEQYGEAGAVRQGPWTDFYALGATLHYVMLGQPPAPSTARMLHDDAPGLAARAPAGYSAEWLQLVDWMLAPKPADRPQSVAELREVLEGRRSVPPAARGATVAPSQDASALLDHTVVMPRPQGLAAVSAVHAAPAVAAAAQAPAPRRSQGLWLGAAAVVVAAVLAGGYALLKPAAAPPGASALQSAAPAASAAVPALAPAPTPSVATPPVATVAEPAASMAATEAPGTQAPAVGAAPAAAAAVVVPVPAPDPRPSPPAAATADAKPTRPAEPAPKPADRPAAEKPGPSQPVRAGGTSAEVKPPPAQTDARARPAPPAATPPVTETDTYAETAGKGPEAICSTRPPLRYFACMERQCWRAENRQHPDCLKWRKDVPGNP